MSYIAGQAAGPIGLNFFVDTHEWPCYMIKKSNCFLKFLKTAGPIELNFFVDTHGWPW